MRYYVTVRGRLLLLPLVVGGCFSTPDLHGPEDSCAVLDRASLVAYLPLDEIDDGKVRDASPHHHDGLVSGPLALEEGRVGQGLRWAGRDEFVDLGRGAAVDQLSAITACAWIQPGTGSTIGMSLFDKSSDGLAGGWNVFVIDKGASVGLGLVNRWGVYEQTAGIIPKNGVWSHVCATWDGADSQRVEDDLVGIRLWVEGVEATTEYVNEGFRTSSPANDSAWPLRIGSGRTGGDDVTFRGMIDEVVIFEEVLDATSIRAVHDCAP